MHTESQQRAARLRQWNWQVFRDVVATIALCSLLLAVGYWSILYWLFTRNLWTAVFLCVVGYISGAAGILYLKWMAERPNSTQEEVQL